MRCPHLRRDTERRACTPVRRASRRAATEQQSRALELPCRARRPQRSHPARIGLVRRGSGVEESAKKQAAAVEGSHPGSSVAVGVGVVDTSTK